MRTDTARKMIGTARIRAAILHLSREDSSLSFFRASSPAKSRQVPPLLHLSLVGRYLMFSKMQFHYQSMSMVYSPASRRPLAWRSLATMLMFG